MAKIRIMFLITELHIGGAQNSLLQLLSALDRSKFEVMVACFYNGDKVTANKIKALGISVFDVQFRRPWHLSGLWRLSRLIKREKLDVLHTWLYHANVIGRLIGKCHKVPIIITSRRNVDIGGRIREWVQFLTRSLDEATIAVCESARQAEILQCGADPDKVITIYNGIDFSAFEISGEDLELKKMQTLKTDYDSVCLGSIGRLHPQKGYAYLLQAIRIVKDTYTGIRLVIVGDGILRKELVEQTRILGLGDQVVFAGFRDDIPTIMSSLDIFVLPSLWEGMPNVLLEAMAAGLPVIATNVGGIPEMVVNGATGILIPPKDPERMADAIIRLIKQPDLRIRMGQAGRDWVQSKFSIQETVARTEALYHRLILDREKFP